MKTLLTFFALIPLFCLSQTHSIDEHMINFEGSPSDEDFTKNTYYNALEDVSVDWIIIDSSMPEEWGFSNCFPNCFLIGTTSNTGEFLSGSSQYLNCHFYPHETAGEGMVKMEITTNDNYIDTVTWNGVALGTSDINDWYELNSSEIETIYDMSGRKINGIKEGQINLVQYKDGSIQKIYTIKN